MSATKMDGNAAQPSSIPRSPFRMRCTLLGPMGTWMSEPTKKVAARIATVISLS